MTNQKIGKKKVLSLSVLAILILLLVFAVSLSGQGIAGKAYDMEENLNGQVSERTVICEISIEDDFTNDIILVSLTQEATLRFKSYTIEDFPEVKLARVTEMTEHLASRAEQQIRNDGKGITIHSNVRKIDIDSFRRILQLELAEPNKEAILEAISLLERRNDVRSAEPNYVVNFSSHIPNDPFLSDQWAINHLQLPQAWHTVTGNGHTRVRVGIVDSGIDAVHPDISSQLNMNLSRDYTGGNNPYFTNSAHGTHVAGIVGATGNNFPAVGIAGANWNAELISLKVASAANVTDALLHAEANNIRILNMSFDVNETTAMNDAINVFDGLIVAAAGNSANNSVGYPARSNNPRIISVGSLDSNGSRSSFSCWGKVEIWAPGGNILSTVPRGNTPADYTRHSDGYAYQSGTSMAAPEGAKLRR